nr:ribonuclease H-like domain-containing protein [Tanacetum cinerariifolium]
MRVNRIPELVYVYSRDISSDEKCRISWSECNSIKNDLKCGFSWSQSARDSSIAFTDINSILLGNKLKIKIDAAHMVAASKVPMLKPGEVELWRMRIEHTNTQNMAFVSSSLNNSNNINGVNTAQVVNAANGVNTASSQVNAASSLNIDNLSDAVIYAFMASQPNSTHLVNKDLEQIHPDDLEEMDLKWQMAMLTITARRFLKNTGRKLNLNGNDSDNISKDVTRRTVPEETSNSSALVSCDGLGGYDWSDQAKERPTNYALMAYSTSSASSSYSERYQPSRQRFCKDISQLVFSPDKV